VSTSAKDLISRLLVVDPKKRFTAQNVLDHPWISVCNYPSLLARMCVLKADSEPCHCR
jgi:serine/threonine protein kinase